jgi:hypothetical protein
MFVKGDLVYVPQSAILYGLGENSLCINKKPSLALFVNYELDGYAKVVLDGKQWLVKKKEIYSNKGA